jgi:hypothetical protein
MRDRVRIEISGAGPCFTPPPLSRKGYVMLFPIAEKQKRLQKISAINRNA